MSINRDKPDLWKKDITKSVDLYNGWFIEFAPKAFKEARKSTAGKVETTLDDTDLLRNISVAALSSRPEILSVLRMSTCPPIAKDRLVGLAGVSKNLIDSMEDAKNPRIPPRMPFERQTEELSKVTQIINKMIDTDIFPWLANSLSPTKPEIQRSIAIVADRLCGAAADPVIRNAQEKRQFAAIKDFLQRKGYSAAEAGAKFSTMKKGTFSFHTNIPVFIAQDTDKEVNIPVDIAILPKTANNGDIPILIEAKSAGDITNVNKRRKEEAVKMQQLKNTYGLSISYNLFLCGYFDSGYLGYEAAEGIDWIWEHRISDLAQLGI